MSRVTSKLQLTLPKVLADRYQVRPGDEVDWEPAGDSIRLVPRSRRASTSIASRLQAFDQATRRIEAREHEAKPAAAAERGWSREDLYDRGRPR